MECYTICVWKGGLALPNHSGISIHYIVLQVKESNVRVEEFQGRKIYIVIGCQVIANHDVMCYTAL